MNGILPLSLLLIGGCAAATHAPPMDPPAPGIFTYSGTVEGHAIRGTIVLGEDVYVTTSLGGECHILARDLEVQRRVDPRRLTINCGESVTLYWDTPTEVRQHAVARSWVATETTRRGECIRWERLPNRQPRCAEYRQIIERGRREVVGQVTVVRQ